MTYICIFIWCTSKLPCKRIATTSGHADPARRGREEPFLAFLTWNPSSVTVAYGAGAAVYSTERRALSTLNLPPIASEAGDRGGGSLVSPSSTMFAAARLQRCTDRG